MNFNAKWLLLIPVLIVAVGLGLLIPTLLEDDGDEGTSLIEEGNLSSQAEADVTATLEQIDDYESLLENSPDDIEILKALADSYYGLAELEVQNGLVNDSFTHFKSAVDNYRKILALQPDNGAVRLSLALAYDGLLMREVAYRELRSVKTSDPQLTFDLANAFIKVGLFAEARESLESIETSDANLMTDIALNYAEDLQLFDQAEAAARQATGIDPANQRAWLTLGFILKSAGKEEEARSVLEKTIELDPQSPIADEAQNFLDG